MKRLFGKFSRSQSSSADEDKGENPPVPQEDVAAVSSEDPITLPEPTSPPAQDKPDAPEFELREPTPEEMSATILSRQDFIDIDRAFAGDTPKRLIQRTKPSVLAPGVAPVAPARAPAPQVAAAAAKPPMPAAPVQAPAAAPVAAPQPAAAAPAAQPVPVAPVPAAQQPVPPAVPKKTPLIGFLEGFFYGKVLSGWVGDPDEPSSRTIKVTAYLDGKEVASAIATRKRSDIEYAGYHVPFPDLMVWKYVLEERLVVRAAREGEPEDSIILKPLAGVFKQANKLKDEEAAKAKPEPSAAPASGTADIVQARSLSAQDLSYVRIPAGTASKNEAVILGRDGFLFGNRGPGNLAGQYRIGPGEELVQRDAARWFVLFRSRAALLQQRSIPYLQTILPEKATVLHDLAPDGFAKVTARLGVLEAMFEAEAKKEGGEPVTHYRSLIAALRSCHAAGVAPYLRTDSGLRTAGTQLVFYQIVQKMAGLLPDHAGDFAKVADLSGHLAPGKESEPFSGDLGKGFDLPIYESEQLPDVAKVAAHAAGDANVIDKRESGSRFIWRNANAATPLKVMAFSADSMGRGGGPIDLSWWFKAMFAEFHLVETAELDGDYVDQHKPDIVIALCAERTLPNPPSR